MAGIGFELKKLFENRGFLYNIRAYFFSTIITVGPMLLCMVMITVLQALLVVLDVSFIQRQLFIASTIYSFIFSQILTGSFSLLISRFISDKVYAKKMDGIMPSFYGILSLCLLLEGTAGALFYWLSPLEIQLKAASYILLLLLVMVWIQTVYLSAMKDYMRIVKGFLYGIGMIVAVSFFWLTFKQGNEAFGLLFSMDAGFFIIAVSFMINLKNFYKGANDRYFSFIEYFDKVPSLFFTGLFYNIGIYAHNFVFWVVSLGVTVGNTFVYAPFYDVPTFYAFLSIIPAMVIFVVEMETSFYEKYKAYYSLIIGGGDYQSIKEAGEAMINGMWSGLKKITGMQLIFTFLFIITGNFILPRIGVMELSLDIFNILVLGTCASSIMLIVIILLLYFEDRRDALIIAAMFLTGNILFTCLTILLGENFYGAGYFISAVLSLFFGLLRLNTFVKDLDFHTFCSQPMIVKEGKSFFRGLEDRIYQDKE